MPSMAREEAMAKLAMELAEWPTHEKPSAELCPGGWCWLLSCGLYELLPTESVNQVIRKVDWLVERERLINKPSWGYAPEWANFLAQDGDGQWVFYDRLPAVKGVQWYPIDKFKGMASGKIPAGHNWRTTLERRPNSQKTALSEECMNSGMGVSDGSTASYYELPEGSREIEDLISYRNMNHFDAMLFILCYDHSFAESSDEKLNIAREMVHYARREVRRLQGVHAMRGDEES